VDAEEVSDRGVGDQSEALRQVVRGAGHGQVPGVGGELAGADAEECGLARPVRTGASGGEGGREVVEDRRAVRPGEGEVAEDDRRVCG
jgi:hypothetical protein